MSLTPEPGGAGKSGFVRGHSEELSRQCGETKVTGLPRLRAGVTQAVFPTVPCCLHPASEALCSNQGTRGVRLRASGPGVATLVLLSPWALAWAPGCDV